MNQVATEARHLNIIELLRSCSRDIYDMILGGYAKRLKSELYKKWIKNILVGEYTTSRIKYADYMRFLNNVTVSKPLESRIALNLVGFFMLILTVSIIVYLILSYFKLVSPFNKGFKPKVFGSISFYIFLILPFKDTLFAPARKLLINAVEFVPIYELIFMFCLGIFFFSRHAVKKRILHHHIETVFRTVQFVTFTSVLLLCTLDMILSPDIPHFIAGSAILLSITASSLLPLRRKISDAVCTHTFPFISNLIFVSYFIALAPIAFQSLGMFKDAYTLNSIVEGIFKSDEFFILLRIAIFTGFVIYCAIREKAEKPTYDGFITEACQDFAEHAMQNRDNICGLETSKNIVFYKNDFDHRNYTYEKDKMFFENARKEWHIFNETHSIVNQAIRQTRGYVEVFSTKKDALSQISDAKISIVEDLDSLDFSKNGPEIPDLWAGEYRRDSGELRPLTSGMQFKCIGGFDHVLISIAIDELIENYTSNICNMLNEIVDLYENSNTINSSGDNDFESKVDTIVLLIRCINLLRDNYKIVKKFPHQNDCLTPLGRSLEQDSYGRQGLRLYYRTTGGSDEIFEVSVESASLNK